MQRWVFRIGRRTLLRVLLMVVVPGLALVAAGYFYVTGGRYVSTDDAYVKAHKVMVAPEVSGRVVALAVHENERVEKDSLLFRVDEKPYRIALAQAQANLGLVRNEILALHASYRQKEAELAQAEEDIAYYQREFERRQKLAKDNVLSASNLDEARHNLDAARLRAAVAQRDRDQVLAQLGATPDLPIEQHPRYLQAQALLDKAALDLQRSAVHAPVTGVIGPLDVRVGDYVKAGTPALPLVETNPYVEANLKETDLTHVQAGQRATVEVDAYPGVTWQARVASLSPATGSDFSLLPAQNATGNWVKVVQRVPVRLAIDAPEGAPPLRAGMSVSVEIDTGYHRPLPWIVRTVMAWIGRGR